MPVDQIPSNSQANPPPKDRDEAETTFDERLMLRSVCEGFDPRALRGDVHDCEGAGPGQLEAARADVPRQGGQQRREPAKGVLPGGTRPAGLWPVGRRTARCAHHCQAAHGGDSLARQGPRVLHHRLRSAYAQGAAAMLTALLAEPKLTSFLIVREPDLERLDLESLHGVLHPTLA
eukprot:782040-Prymnesium_polylepis.1